MVALLHVVRLALELPLGCWLQEAWAVVNREILIVGQDAERLDELLASAGHACSSALSWDHAVTELDCRPVSLVLCGGSGAGGIDFVRRIRRHEIDVPVILVSDSRERGVEALECGAVDYLLEPLNTAELLARIRRALTFQQLVQENRLLAGQLPEHGCHVGASTAMQAVSRAMASLADARASVLLTGERGTGKSTFARAIHQRSVFGARPFVEVNLTEVEEGGLEAQLFGAVSPSAGFRRGLLQTATGGTLFLDKVECLPLWAQTRLLRAIESGEVLAAGATEPMPIHVRLIASTWSDLEAGVEAGLFRRDLHHHLSAGRIHLPALRERREDIPGLTEFVLGRLNKSLQATYATLDRHALDQLSGYSWPGNARELVNVLERAVILGDGTTIQARDLLLEGRHKATRLKEATRGFERSHVLQALEGCGWSRKQAAKQLGISTTSLWRKIQDLGIQAPD